MSDFDAYHQWLGIPPEEQPPNFYQLLDLAVFEKDRAVIIAALDRLQAFLQQKSVGPRGELAVPLLQELQQARLCLLNRLTKAQYDAKLREQGFAAAPDLPSRSAAVEVDGQPALASSTDGFQFPTEGDVEDVSVKAKRMARRSRWFSWSINLLVAGAVAGGIWWLSGKGMLPKPGELLEPPQHQPVAKNVAEPTTPEEPDPANTNDPPPPKPIKTAPSTAVNNPPFDKPTTPIKPVVSVPKASDEQRFADHRETVVDFSLSADGTLLATAGAAGDCRVWEVATGETTTQFTGHTGQVHSVGFAPKGTQALSSAESLKLWNSSTGKELGELKSNRRPVRAIQFFPNNRQVATVGAGAIEVWDVATRKQVRMISGVHPFCGSLALSEDGLTLAAATGEEAEVATLFQTTTGKEIRSFTGHKSRISSLALSRDGKSLWTASNEHLARLWKTKTGESEIVFAHADVLALSSDETLLATGGLNGLVSIWNAQTGSGLLQLPRQKLHVLDIAFLPDGEHLLFAGDSSDATRKTATIQLWKLPKLDPNAPGSRPNSMPLADATPDEPPPKTKPTKNGDAVTKKQPVPTDEQREEAEKKIQERFQQDIAKAAEAADKTELAKKLLGQAKTTTDDSAERYALLHAALDLAIDAGDVELAATILSDLTTSFDVDVLDTTSKAYKQLNTTVKSAALQEQLAEAFLKLAAECATASRIDMAIESTKTAMILAGKAKNPKLRETAKAKTDEYLLKKQSGDKPE